MLLVCLVLASPAAAQDRPVSSELWRPLGPLPVDQAGAGRRGYVLPGEGVDVADPGVNQLSLHAVAANDFYREEAAGFLITERFEAHTVALEYRRGFTSGVFSRVEIGAQLQVHESDSGVLNGFIRGFESAWASVTGSTSAVNRYRNGSAPPPPLGSLIAKDGKPLYRTTGDGSGVGDLYFVAKALVRDRAPSTGGTRVAARIAVNVAGSSAFTLGNFAGIGIGVEKKISSWAALHGDVRTSIFLDRTSQWGLPLRRASLAFSAGPELKLTTNTSFAFQIDGSSTPYQATGTAALDSPYGDVAIGVGHRFRAAGRPLLAQLYARENMNLPFSIRWNLDPDFAAGVKLTVR